MLEIKKETKNNGLLIIKQIDKSIAKDLIITNHYSHKWNSAFGKYNFGIFKDEKLMGVAVFGYMQNPRAKIFTCNNKEAYIIELNRMWIDDELNKNAESILISSSIKLIKQLDKNVCAIQTFADGRIGCGTIYKASNFKYCGFKYSIFWQNIETNEVYHNIILTNTSRKTAYVKTNTEYLNNKLKAFRVKTYRYIYILDKSFAFKFKEEQYPEYNKGIEYIEVKRNKEKIIDNINRLNQTNQ